MAFGEIEMDVSPSRLEERITDHIIHKRTDSTFRQQLGDRAEDIALERESARDASAD